MNLLRLMYIDVCWKISWAFKGVVCHVSTNQHKESHRDLTSTFGILLYILYIYIYISVIVWYWHRGFYPPLMQRKWPPPWGPPTVVISFRRFLDSTPPTGSPVPEGKGPWEIICLFFVCKCQPSVSKWYWSISGFFYFAFILFYLIYFITSFYCRVYLSLFSFYLSICKRHASSWTLPHLVGHSHI